MRMMVVLVENLVKRYREMLALDHFNLQVSEGEILGLLGPNGCGKTTAINCMLSLLKYDKGEIRIFGEKMRPDSYELKRKIGVVPQEVSVLQNLTVYENIDYFCGLYVDDPKERKRLIEEAIEFVDLGDYRKFFPKKLSGGLKRRLNIACGIVHKPQLIFLDEPTVAVDAQSRNFMLEGIKKLRERGSTIIYTTHYLEEVEMLCDHIVIMDKGKNIAEGTKSELIDMIGMSEKVLVDFLNLSKEQEERLRKQPRVSSLTKKEEGYVLEFQKGGDNLTELLDFIRRENLLYHDLYSQKPSLNDVFLALTGKELRD